MRLICFLRDLRGDRSLRELETETGISRGELSLYERGIKLPIDKHVAILEDAYGPRSRWYPPEVLVELQRGDGEP